MDNMATISSIFGIKSSHSSKHHPHVLQSASSSTSSMTPLTSHAAASEDKNFVILKELASLSANRNCFDCLQRGPTYVNMTVGSFICTSCSGKLRGLNPPHRVKSISMAVFSDDEIDFLKNRGNDFCHKVWLGKYPGPLLPLEKENDSKLMDILTARYERKCWYAPPSDLMFEEARKKAESELNRKNKTTSSSCKTTQTEHSISRSLGNSSLLSVDQLNLQQLQLSNHNAMATSNANSSSTLQPLASSPFVRSPIKPYLPATPQPAPTCEPHKFSFQNATADFADFSRFSNSSPVFTPPGATSTTSNVCQTQAFHSTGTPQKFMPVPHHQFYSNPHQHQPLSIPVASMQDKYAPFHDLTTDMDSLSINWDGSCVSTDHSQRSAWKSEDQMMADAYDQCEPRGKNPFAGVMSSLAGQGMPPTNQFHMGQHEQVLHYPNYVPMPPAAGSYAAHIPPGGLNQTPYESMLYQPPHLSVNSAMHRYNYHNSSQSSFMFQPPYYYQSFLQYNPSNPFLNQQVENKNTNPFL